MQPRLLALPQPLGDLVQALNRLPGIGPRSAERIALHLVQAPAHEAQELAARLLAARDRVRSCEVCGMLTEPQPCAICADPQRDPVLCLVERPVDVLLLEKAGSFRGKYHVLGGRISPLNGVEPEDLRIAELETRFGREPITEIILALGTDVEGEATSFYLARRLAGHGARITRLAYGLPAGSGLEFADELTVSRALEDRRDVR